MQIAIAPTPTSPAPAAEAFGQQNQQAASPFALFLALLGQAGISLTPDLAATLPDGQNVPSTPATTSGTLPKLPVSHLIEATADDAADGTDLLALLQSLSSTATLSPELKNLLTGDHLDLDTLQQRLAALDDDTQQVVLGEIAALLQPVVAALPPLPLQAGTESNKLEQVAASTPAGPATPTDFQPLAADQPDNVQAPEANPQPQHEKALQPDANSASHADADHLPEHIVLSRSDKAATKLSESDADTAEPDTQAQAAADADAQPAQTANAQASIRILKPRQSAADSAPAVSAVAVNAPQPAQPGTHAVKTDAKTTPAIKPVAAGEAGGQSAGEAALKDLLAGNTPLPQPVADKQIKTDFADHLQDVKLNRTGAHVPVADQITVQLSKAVADGRDHFTVKLSPAELGRIEIKVDMAADGRVTASFKVDQPATLDLLQRDHRGLERMLSDAGLKADSSSLNFNLRGDAQGQQQGGQQAQNNSGGNDGHPGFSLDGELMAEELPPAGTIEATWYAGPDRLDLHV